MTPSPGHGLGKGQGGLIFMHPFGADLVVFQDIEVLPPHLLQAAEVTYPDHLALFKGWTFAGPWHDHGHIVQSPAAHRLLRRQRLQGRAWGPNLFLLSFRQIKGLPLAGPADAAILGRIAFPAEGADDDRAPAALAEKLGPDL